MSDPGPVRANGNILDLTLSLDTAAYASGDVLADTQAIVGAARFKGGPALLHSIVVVDEDDQGAALDLVFLAANRSLGTENGAPSITDTNARDVLGVVPVVAGDYVDLGGVRVATLRAVGLALEAAADTRDIYVAAITRGTPTHTAFGLKLRFGLI